MKKKLINNVRIQSEIYNYDIEPVVNHGSRAVKVLVKDGDYAGKSAFVITMPDSVSGCFPEIGVFDEMSKRSITKP